MNPKISSYRKVPLSINNKREPKQRMETMAAKAHMTARGGEVWTASGLKTSAFEAQYAQVRESAI